MIVANTECSQLQHFRKSFYVGSILPDCKPSFLTTKHEFDGTFQKTAGNIRRLTDQTSDLDMENRSFWIRLGEVLHYIADYFTFPHNDTFAGNLKEHCIYEKHLKNRLKNFIRSGKAEEMEIEEKTFGSADALVEFVKNAHADYVRKKRSVEEDIRYIVRVCTQVMGGVMQLAAA